VSRSAWGSVVVAVEDVVSARAALSWVVSRTRLRPARTRLVSVVSRETSPDPLTAEYLAHRFVDEVVEAGRVLDVVRRVLVDAVPRATVECDVREGGVRTVLMQESRAADLVVVGAHRRNVHLAGDPGGRWGGSTGEFLAAASSCPVVVVPGPVPAAGPVVVGDDGSATARRALDVAAREALLRSTDLQVVRVRTTGAVVDATFGDVVAAARLRHPRVNVQGRAVDHGCAPDGLLATTSRAQLLVVGAGGTDEFRTSPLGSTSRSLVHRSPIPLIVVPQPEDEGSSSTTGTNDPARLTR